MCGMLPLSVFLIKSSTSFFVYSILQKTSHLMLGTQMDKYRLAKYLRKMNGIFHCIFSAIVIASLKQTAFPIEIVIHLAVHHFRTGTVFFPNARKSL